MAGVTAPGQPDAPRIPLEPLLPRLHLRRVRVDIRDSCRDRSQFRSEGQRQTEQRALPGELRQRLAAAHHLRCTVGSREQTTQRRLNFQHDLSASSRDQRNIAHELERVPETLFGIKQNALTAERFAFPSALDQPSVIANPDLPAGFIFGPAGRQIALQQMDKSQIGSCLGGVRLQGAQAMKAIGGFGQLAQSVKNESQITIGGNAAEGLALSHHGRRPPRR